MFDALPPLRRRARGLTEEDRAVWRAFVARGVTPLRGRALPDAPSPAPSGDPASGAIATAAAAAAPVRSAGLAPPPRLPPAVAVNTPPPGLDARRWRDLRRGRTRPERTLDLHGYRATEAHAAVRAFLHAAQAEGLRCVAIVTGRGGAGPEGGVLRRELPHWLNAPDLCGLVLGAAHPHAAQGGAVHLLLRRRRGGGSVAPGSRR